MDQYRSKRKIKEQVFKTVWHEVAHHFGADEEGAVKAEHRMFTRYMAYENKRRTQKREVKINTRVQRGRKDLKRKSKITFRVKSDR
jgi:hypothetical protein